MRERSVIGIDVAKYTFSVCWMSKGGSVKRRLRMVARTKLMSKVTQLASPGGAVVAMEACSGSQHWARRFASLGYSVKLIAGQHVKPFVKSQKNDDKLWIEAGAEELEPLIASFTTVCREGYEGIRW